VRARPQHGGLSGRIWYCGVTAQDIPEIVRSHSGKGCGGAAGSDRYLPDSAARCWRTARSGCHAAGAGRGRECFRTTSCRRSGFQESRVLLSAVELDAFTAVGSGARAAEAAARMGTDPRATEMLLNALVAMELLAKRDGAYHNVPAGQRFLVASSPDYARRPSCTLSTCGGAGRHSPMREGGDFGVLRGDARSVRTGPRPYCGHGPQRRRARAAGGAGGRRRRCAAHAGCRGGSAAYSIAFARAAADLKPKSSTWRRCARSHASHITRLGWRGASRRAAGDLRTDPLGAGTT